MQTAPTFTVEEGNGSLVEGHSPAQLRLVVSQLTSIQSVRQYPLCEPNTTFMYVNLLIEITSILFVGNGWSPPWQAEVTAWVS